MGWLVFAFSGPVLWGLSFHFDKYLIDHYFKKADVAVLIVFTALISALMLPFILAFDHRVTSLPVSSASIMLLGGAMSMGAMVFYLRALQTEDVAIVAPLFQLTPIFAFILGYVALGETPSHGQLLGGGIIVLGTLVLVWQRGQTTVKARLVVLMTLCTAILAVTTVIFKIFALREAFWPTVFWTYAGEALFGLSILVVPTYRAQFRALFQIHPVALLGVNGTNELINLGGALGARYALLSAPVGLVQAIGSTTSLFVFLFGVLWTWLAPGIGSKGFSRAELMRKLSGAVLITLGTVLSVVG